jgi:hypothetical protein
LEQQQVLQGLDSVLPCEVFAESHEFADLVAKVGKYLEIVLVQGEGLAIGHKASGGQEISADRPASCLNTAS